MPGQSFHRQFLTTKVTVPASTAQATPQVTSWALGNVLIAALSVRVPAGHAGLTGVAILYNGLPIFPFGNPVTYVITTGETLRQEFDDMEVSSALTVNTFNTDVFAHSFYLRADIDVFLPLAGAPGPISLVSIA